MNARLLSALIFALSASVAPLAAHAEEKAFPAKLAAQVVLPANTIIPAPADAPEALKTAGKFTTSDRKRAQGIGTVPGMDGVHPTGLSLPFDGQAVQGLSGIKTMADGTFWTLTDNGFGTKLNSVDAMLMLHHVKLDWAGGKFDRMETIFLSDPNKIAPFPIVMEGAEKRYLTGSDFDLESIQPVADGFWLGEEFGPYLMKVNLKGELEAVYPTTIEGKPVMSPDNPTLTLPSDPTKPLPAGFNLRRSNGFEGMAMSKDGSKLYALLEGPLYLGEGKFEQVDGQNALRIAEFDTKAKAWTGRSWLYPLSAGGTNIGDFNMIDGTTALVLERDGGEGTADKACADPAKPQVDCFEKPAKHKRVYKIEMTDENAGKAVRKIGYIDLMNIADPDKKASQGTKDGIYTMPFVTIENVDVVDATHIVVGNDNNLPFSIGRFIDKADDNEMVLLDVGDFLTAK
ncbi:glycerophosphodiester phosphodiesterase [Rhizobium rhizosphaerae]|uniref:Glycerophosphodiester phosphodiesterase n=1 Tax=Xaviernesmea rhizosphaerae TaxID=1672749 RepID=A0ABX3PB81_9HYPH|nr:esterase-like activity of phytase family protein [Xaviernesmea rhizosphaerae]OQP85734.1 glycerophosphodiester phosphodiesterase [Xaviernesmea rhizosphaerae]